MEIRANDLCRALVLTAIILFFGISLWILSQVNPAAEVFLIFDIVSVWLMILIVFWLIVAEKGCRERRQEP